MGHLHKFELENFRLFKEMQAFDFAPISLFTGVNNSGKSSVIKSLLLLKESFNKSKKISELLFTESKHNLGSFTQCTNNQNNNEKYLKFKLPLSLKFFDNDCSIELEYRPNLHFSENGDLKAFKIFHKNKEIIKFDLNPDLKVNALLNTSSIVETSENEKELIIDFAYIERHVRNAFLKAKEKKTLTPQKEKKTEAQIEVDNIYMSEHWQEELDYLEKENERKNSCFNSFFKVSSGFPYENNDKIDPKYFFSEQNDETNFKIDFTEHMFLINDKTTEEIINNEIYNKKIKEKFGYFWTKSSIVTVKFFEESTTGDSFLDFYLQSIANLQMYVSYNCKLSDFGKLIFTKLLEESIIESVSFLLKSIKSIYSLSSLRGNTERMYSNNSEIVDINNIIIQFLESDVYLKDSSIAKFINSSLKLYNIGDQLSINRHQGVASEIFIHRGDKKILLADLGFGFTQLLPIILKVAIIAKENQITTNVGTIFQRYNSTILILEEPESNLHPSYQSKLADLIKDAASKFNIQFIIETHSEYLIRKLQFLVAKKDIKSQDVSLFYFNEPDIHLNGEKLVKKIEIQKDGSLSSEFGNGFFDEADNLAIQLFVLNKNASN